MASLLIISHPDGRRYAVGAADFRKGADDEYRGFRVDGHEDGSPYDGPRTAAAVVKAQEVDSAPEKPAAGKKASE